jgi:hypothetical protein
LADGKKLNIVPVNKNAVAISSDGIAEVIIGIAGPNNTGALEFYNGLTGAFEGTLPLPDPVKMISSTTSAGSLLVLLTTNLVRSVAVINMATKDISKIIPVSDGTLSISNGRDPSTFFALQNNQTVQSISLNSGQIESYINLQQPGINLALSNDENVLLVLKCSVNFCNIALVNTSTDEIYNTLPAPLDCIGLELSSDGNTIYDLVDTHSSSNIQSYNVATYIQ